MKTVLMMYVTLIPAILGGVFNMIWCKLPVLRKSQTPIDRGKNFCDGKRIFGDNKTWKGLFGYVLVNILSAVLWGAVCGAAKIEHLNYFYINRPNSFLYNVLLGVLLGLAYGLFELPNSFLKRRFDIKPGRPAEGPKKIFFFLLDQADSVFGCVIVVCVFYHMSVLMYFAYVALGAFTHVAVNLVLYALKLRKNMF